MSASPFRRFWHRVLAWSGPVLLVLLALFKVCEWQSERLWFESLSYGSQFGRLLLWRAGGFAAGALLFAVWLGLNAHVAWRNAAARAVPLSFFQSDDAARLIPLEDKFQLDRYRRRATVLMVAALSYLAGLGFSARYALFLRAFSTIGTGQRDSASNFDLAFFLFALPFYQWLSRVLLSALVTALLLVAAIYLYEETLGAPAPSSLFPTRKVRAPHLSRPAARHLAMLWAMLLIWKGLDCVLSVPLSFVSSGNVAARVFDPIDIRLGWTSAALFGFAAPLIALLSGLSIAREPRYRTFALGAAWMICAGAVPFLLPRVVGRNPNDAGWRMALSRHIKSTRHAWQLDSIERRSLLIASDAPFRSISQHLGDQEVAPPLALWPAESAIEALNARLAARGTNFRVSQVFLERAGNSLRYVGLAAPQNAGKSADWRARHERAPVGLWVQMDATRCESAGAPIFLPDIAVPALLGAAPVSAAASRVQNPIISAQSPENEVADDADEWIFTSSGKPDTGNTKIGDEAPGVRGISLLQPSARWLLGARFFAPQLAREASSAQITWHRGAGERCRTLAPFLDWRDVEARPVVLFDHNSAKNERVRLVYLVPGLVWSDDYPDSATPAAAGTAPPGVNYGRQVAVGVVDAGSGAVTLYTLDEDEPFMALYNRAFPGLFVPPTSLPNEIRAALRPSAALLGAQALIWARYHHENSDRESLAWAAQNENYRPLLVAENGVPALRPLTSQSAGDWLCIAYARPESQVSSGGVSPRISILGADERDFGARGARVRFVEWKANAPLPLPDILVEPTVQLVANRPTLPPPTTLGLAPRFDAKNNAIGLFASRGEVQFDAAKLPDAPRVMRLKVAMQISGAEQKVGPGPLFSVPLKHPSALFSVGAMQQLEGARAAWRDLRFARQKGDWAGVARAEKRLGEALSEKSPPKP